MKVLLIQLYDENVPVYPMGLVYLASALTGHNVRVFDQNTCEGDPFIGTGQAVAEFLPDVVGISLRNLCFYSQREKRWAYYYEQLTPTVSAIRGSHAKAVIVAGGAGFSLFPEEIMTNEPGIDLGVYLEGEYSFRELLEHLGSPGDVGGIYLRKAGKVLFTGDHTRPDFASIDAPKRDFVDPWEYGGQYSIGVQSKRGCILKCIYCSYPAISGNFLRMRTAAHVVDEIEKLQSEYGVTNFAFVDNVFNVPLSHAEEICREIIKRGIRIQWTAWFNEGYMTREFVDLAIRAGCRTFEFSPDGYSNKSLKWLNKNIKTKHIVEAYRLLKDKPGIEVKYHFMMGIPGQDVISLIRLVFFTAGLKLCLGKQLKRLHFNWLYILPNTEAQRLAVKNNIIGSDADLLLRTRYVSGVTRVILRVLRLVKNIMRPGSVSGLTREQRRIL